MSLSVFLSLLALTPLGLSLPVADACSIPSTAPSFALDYAPVVYLHSQEYYMPFGWDSLAAHTHPYIDTTPIKPEPSGISLDNLDKLNTYGKNGSNVFLTSPEGIQNNPTWLAGFKPMPDGSTPDTHSHVIVTVTKPNNTVDVFYFYLYAYNRGPWAFGFPCLDLGDHVGDLEHTMIRFVNKAPETLWLSQHTIGEAYTYSAVEKYAGGLRPVVYSANGSHASFTQVGTHNHSIPNSTVPLGSLKEYTDKGIFWDPLKNSYIYDYNTTTKTFTSYNGKDPIGWLSFAGGFGDGEISNATGQVHIFDQIRYEGGPTGLQKKDLARSAPCPTGVACPIKTAIPVL